MEVHTVVSVIIVQSGSTPGNIVLGFSVLLRNERMAVATAAPDPGCGRDVNLCSVAVELRSAAQTRHRRWNVEGDPALWPRRLIIRA